MTIRDIAGFCPEEAVWKMMADVSAFLLKEHVGYVLTPDSIVIDGQNFMVETKDEIVNEFMAPEYIEGAKNEGSLAVWSLGAVAYYMATGHIVFGGHGSCYQKEHPLVSLPVLPKGLQELSFLLQKCLYYSPNDRISLEKLNELSLQGVHFCEKRQRKTTVLSVNGQETKENNNGEKWPEEMIEV